MHGGGLAPVFQPLVSLASGRVVGYEALSRPSDGAGRPLPPEQLFASAAHHGASRSLNARALAAFAGRWQQPGPGVLLFVNISPQALHEGVVDDLVALRPPWARIVVEVTEEDRLGDDDLTLRAIKVLRGHGARIAIDDFGAGYSGLRRLLLLRPEFLKLDLSLVRDIDYDHAKQLLTESTVRTARAMGIVLVAEGIERPEELATLRKLGVDLGQGYLLGRPQEAFADAEPASRHPAPDERVMVASDDVARALFQFLRLAARHTEKDPTVLLDMLTVITARITGADSATILRLEDDQLTVASSFGHVERVPMPRDGDSLAAYAVRADRTVVVADVQRQAEAVPGDGTLNARLGRPRSVMITPVYAGTAIWGVLGIDFREPGRTSPRIQGLLEGVAAACALVVKRTEGAPAPDLPSRHTV